MQTPRSVKKEGEEMLQVPEQRFPCSEDHGEAGCPPAVHEVHGGADIHLQLVENPTLEQEDAQRRL